MKIWSNIKQFLHLAPRSTWQPRIEKTTFGADSVFVGAKSWHEDEVIPEHSLAPGKSHDLKPAAHRELKERVELRNGTVLSEDAVKREVTIQPANGNPLILPKASMKIDGGQVVIENRDIRQKIAPNGSFTIEDLHKSVKHQKVRYYTSYSVDTLGTVRASEPQVNDNYYNTYVSHTQLGVGKENPQGYLQVNNKLIAPLVSRKYIVAAN